MNSKKRAAVDLLWVRPKQVGGIESYIRNLLDGFGSIDDEFELWLLVSKDNKETFLHYQKDKRFHVHVCDLISANVGKRIIWQNINLGKTIRKLGLKVCFEPYYCKPVFGIANIKFITTIHDLQAYHYPDYFSRGKVLWMKFSWWNTIRTSDKVVAISKFVKEDIIEKYKAPKSKITTIYNPITINTDDIAPFDEIGEKYCIEDKGFFFTVSSLLPHKNVGVLLDVMKQIIEKDLPLPHKLIISGIGGKSRGELEETVKKYNMESCVYLTPFIEDSERNALYKHCYAFLFPSIFEGFGMPPIEAMLFGTPVVTTRKTCLEEVTQGKATYVEDPNDVDEWIKKIVGCKNGNVDFSCYDKKRIAREYLEVIFS